MRSSRLLAVAVLMVLACAYASHEALSAQMTGRQITMMKPALRAELALLDSDMRSVIVKLVSLGGKPIEKLTAEEARRQPSPTDAVKALLRDRAMSNAPKSLAGVKDSTIPGPAGSIPVRIYTPAGTGPFPVMVYFHGGGWVIADLNTYDASPRAFAKLAKQVIVSVAYRQAPEHRFPAAVEDSYAATQWVMNNATKLGGDPDRVSVGGESAGGNLAAVVCLLARDRHGKMPVHQTLVYPITNYAFDTGSYVENAKAVPLNRAMMKWFFDRYLRTPADGASPYVSPLRARSLAGLPPATVITAQADPLRSEGKAYADRLQSFGVPVHYRYYPGVTHEFFGMGAVVAKARQAEAFAAQDLTSTSP